MVTNSLDYYRRRLLQSEERAALATMPGIRAIHHDLARRYAELLGMGDGAAPRLGQEARLR